MDTGEAMSARRKAKRNAALLIGAALACGSCAPGIVYDTPYFRARLLDAATARPVANASVTVWNRHDPRFRATTRSDANGIVFLPPVTREASNSAPGTPIPPPGGAWIEAAGYRSQELVLTLGGVHSDVVPLMPTN
jgi:hypothetical protein